jgi:NADPH2:quinone reductase
MAKSIEIIKPGSPEVMRIVDKPLRKLMSKEVLINQTAIGINHFDLHFRAGRIKVRDYPLTLGFEAVGVIEDRGPDVDASFEIGKRVAYATGPIGAYTTKRIIDSKFVVSVPDKISDEEAAACFFKGLAAHYLLRRVFLVVDNNYILIHGVTGGLGTLMSQWCKNLKAKVIGTVGDDNKMPDAFKNGCSFVFNYNDPELKTKIMDATSGKGATVIYDLLGKATFNSSMTYLRKFGVYIAVGDTSGPLPSFSLQDYARQSYYFCAPSIFSYKEQRMELVLSADEVFNQVINKKLEMPYKKFQFKDVINAHKALESRKTIGANILVV